MRIGQYAQLRSGEISADLEYPSRLILDRKQVRVIPFHPWFCAVGILAGDLCRFAVAILFGWMTACLIDVYLVDLAFEVPIMSIDYMVVFGITVVGACVWFARKGRYTERRPFRTDVADIIGASTLCLLVNGFTEFASKANFPRLWLVTTWILAVAREIVVASLLSLGLHHTYSALDGQDVRIG